MNDLSYDIKWQNYDLSFFEAMGLYLAEKRIDYSKENDTREIGLINTSGDWVYRCKEYEYIGFRHHFHCSPLDEKLNKSLSFWTLTKDISTLETPKFEISIFKYQDAQVVKLLPDKTICAATPISKNKIVLGILPNTTPLGSSPEVNIQLFDTSNGNLTEILSTRYIENRLCGNLITEHHIYGGEYLFSVNINDEDNYGPYYLYNTNGGKMFDFELKRGSHGEDTCFEPSKNGFGILYKSLENPVKLAEDTWIDTSECLIDAAGNFYGEFYKIHGAIPSTGVKSFTKYPKFIDGKVLCLRIPEENHYSYLSIIDKKGIQIDTQFQCPWLDSSYFNSCSLINNAMHFGKKCIVVIDSKNMLHVIDFEGKKIDGLTPMEYQGLAYKYSYYFINQVL